MVLGFKDRFVIPIQVGAKIHTIREDKPNRWKAGNKIHFATGIRTPKYNQFGSGTCVSVQKIEIIYSEFGDSFPPDIYVDGRELSLKECETLANKDGFASLRQMCVWFKEDFTGKLIHWTGHKY